MLSPGNHHRLMSRDLETNLKQRKELYELARGNKAVQRRLVQMCKEDILFYLLAFAWQHDPSKSGVFAVAPFITFPRQEELLVARPETHRHLYPYDRGVLWCIDHDKTMACEKSRWQGASWLFLFVMNWHCGFHEYRDWLCVSRNEDAVDDGSKKSLFWKLRYIQASQPSWLMGEIESTKLYFHFKRTGSEITGEASTAKAGVGGRGSAIFVDEYPEIEKGQEVREKTALTANCRFFVGTHLGAGTPFAQMCDPRQSPEVVRQRLHWTEGLDHQRAGMYCADPENPGIPKLLDPSYEFPPDYPFILEGSPTGGHRPGVRSPWYDRKCAEIGDSRAVAQNLDIDVAGAAKQFFDPLKISQLIAEAKPPVWEGEVEHDRQGQFLGLTPAKGGRLKLWVRPDGFGNLPASRYCTGADVAGGTGATNSCFAAIDGDRQFKVLEWADPRTDEKQFAAMCVALCRWLKWPDGGGAYFGWDNSGQNGSRFCNAIQELQYGHIYFNEEDLAVKGLGKSRKAGWYGSNNQRYDLLKEYRRAIYERVLADRSEECLRETLLFEYDKKTGVVQHTGEIRNNDPTGAGKNHGDMVIATGIAWMLAKDMAEGGRRSKQAEASGPAPQSIEWLEALAQGWRRSREEVYY